MLIQFRDDIEVQDAITGLSLYDLNMSLKEGRGDYVYEVTDSVGRMLTDQGRRFVRLSDEE